MISSKQQEGKKSVDVRQRAFTLLLFVLFSVRIKGAENDFLSE